MMIFCEVAMRPHVEDTPVKEKPLSKYLYQVYIGRPSNTPMNIVYALTDARECGVLEGETRCLSPSTKWFISLMCGAYTLWAYFWTPLVSSISLSVPTTSQNGSKQSQHGHVIWKWWLSLFNRIYLAVLVSKGYYRPWWLVLLQPINGCSYDCGIICKVATTCHGIVRKWPLHFFRYVISLVLPYIWYFSYFYV